MLGLLPVTLNCATQSIVLPLTDPKKQKTLCKELILRVAQPPPVVTLYKRVTGLSRPSVTQLHENQQAKQANQARTIVGGSITVQSKWRLKEM